MIQSFIHLHAHSYFSLMEGLVSPDGLVTTARKNGMEAIALTDHKCLSGAVEFENACVKNGIQPIYGMELDVSWKGLNGPIVLLVMEREGWSNICRLSSRLMLAENINEAETITFQELSLFQSGLILLTGGQRSILDTYIQRSQNEAAIDWLNALHMVFNDRLYIELQQHDPQSDIHVRRLVSITKPLNIPFVATQEIYYLEPEDEQLQKTLSSMRLNCKLKDLPPEKKAPENSYFPTNQQMLQKFAWISEAIDNTHVIFDRCRFKLPLGELHFPKIDLPEGKTIEEVLKEKAFQGATRRYGHITSSIADRLNYELAIISQKKYEPIFLIVEELLDYARQIGVPISSRGSAASSLVAYCLGITNPDPLALNLYFERFLNPARSSPPDIDTDLCSRRRDLVIQHVFKTYGKDRVAMVATINRFRPRSALGEVAKAHGLTSDEVRQLVESLPYYRSFGMSEEEQENPFAGLESIYPKYQMIFKQAMLLLEQPRHLSMHPGGILVAPGEITDIVPVMRSGGKGVTITQYDLDGVEQFGLVKIDLLGIRGLSVLGDVAEAIYSWRRSEYVNAMQVLQDIPLSEKETSDKVRAGQTIGCFQIESPGMRATLREIQADSPDDIMSALALYRPGPLRGGLRDAFVRRFKQLEPVEQIHPVLEPILAESYGVILYQEQVLRIAHDLGGLSLADSDLLRRAMSHFDPGEQMKTLKMRFLEGFQNKNVPLDKAEQVWEMMAAFAGYGFPKAHAASYALVAWQAAWCKTHFPAEFMAAVLANGGGYYSQRVYLSEARRLGLKTKPPHINHSQSQFCVTYPKGEPTLFMGLDQVSGLTQHTQERIFRNRPFHSLNEFLTKVDPRKSELENLIRSDALQGLGTIPGLLEAVGSGTWKKNQPTLFDWKNEKESDWSLEERAIAQEEILGVSVDVHPLEMVVDQTSAAGAISSIEAALRMGESVVVAGSRLTSRRARTSKGDLMYFLSIEDLEGLLDIVFFPAVYNQFRQELRGSGPYLIRGKVELDSDTGEMWIRAEKVRNLKK